MNIERFLEILENNPIAPGAPRGYSESDGALLLEDMARRIVSLENERAALAAPSGSRPPQEVLPLSADHDID